MEENYKPISCAYYDEFEAAAVKNIECEIIFLEDNKQRTIKSKIIDLKTKNKEEFMILENKKTIRLDNILCFNKTILKK